MHPERRAYACTGVLSTGDARAGKQTSRHEACSRPKFKQNLNAEASGQIQQQNEKAKFHSERGIVANQ